MQGALVTSHEPDANADELIFFTKEKGGDGYEYI